MAHILRMFAKRTQKPLILWTCTHMRNAHFISFEMISKQTVCMHRPKPAERVTERTCAQKFRFKGIRMENSCDYGYETPMRRMSRMPQWNKKEIEKSEKRQRRRRRRRRHQWHQTYTVRRYTYYNNIIQSLSRSQRLVKSTSLRCGMDMEKFIELVPLGISVSMLDETRKTNSVRTRMWAVTNH